MSVDLQLPTLIYVSKSQLAFQAFSDEIKKQLPELIILWISPNDAHGHFDKYRPKNVKRQGFDFWVPEISVVNCHRRFRRQIRQYIR